MGMFSLIDAFLDQPLAYILSQLPIAVDIKEPCSAKKAGLRMFTRWQYRMNKETGKKPPVGKKIKARRTRNN